MRIEKRKFENRLKRLVFKDFNYDEALKLSKDMHEHEYNGGTITHYEDTLWAKLTVMTLEHDEKMERTE